MVMLGGSVCDGNAGSEEQQEAQTCPGIDAGSVEADQHVGGGDTHDSL